MTSLDTTILKLSAECHMTSLDTTILKLSAECHMTSLDTTHSSRELVSVPAWSFKWL